MLACTIGGCAERVRPVDERLVLALEEARAWQHRADLELLDGRVDEALHDVEQVLRVAFPTGAAEAEETRLDAWARLAQIRSGRGDEPGALGALESGRREASRDSFYRAHLEAAAGEVLEARGRRLEAVGGAAAREQARETRREALDAYARSIEINRRVQAALAKEGR
jgi:hypothetical protein